jgi:hypothetical protein
MKSTYERFSAILCIPFRDYIIEDTVKTKGYTGVETP